MSAGIRKREKIIAAAAVTIAGLLLGGYFAVSMQPGKGLKISPPAVDLPDTQKGAENQPQNIDQIGSASLMAFFGLDIDPPATAASATSESKKPEPTQVATPTAAVPAPPPPVDLDKKGYKLRGIVLEDGRSDALFLFPAKRRF